MSTTLSFATGQCRQPKRPKQILYKFEAASRMPRARYMYSTTAEEILYVPLPACQIAVGSSANDIDL